MTDVADAIDEEGREVSLVRKSAGSYDTTPGSPTYGEYTPGGTTTTPIVASLQPPSGRLATMMANKPEGIQAESKLVMWTRAELKEDDEIHDGAKRYRVLDVEDWQADGGYSVGFLGSLGDTP